MFDDEFSLREHLEEFLDRPILLHLLTDSKSMIDILTQSTRTSEKRLMLKIRTARQDYQSKSISYTGFVRSDHNLADGLTKSLTQSALNDLLNRGATLVKFNSVLLDQTHPNYQLVIPGAYSDYILVQFMESCSRYSQHALSYILYLNDYDTLYLQEELHDANIPTWSQYYVGHNQYIPMNL